LKTIYIFLILIGLFSCNQNISEKKLNGTWYGIEKNSPVLVFRPDTLALFLVENPQNVLWKANNRIIKFEYFPSNSKEIKKVEIEYQIKNDTLETLFNGEKGIYLKANNYVEFLNKKFNLKFILPKNRKLKTLRNGKENGLRIFVGKRKGKIISKTEFSDNLNNLSNDINKFKLSFYNPMNLRQRLHYRVFADKNISKSKMEKVYRTLRKSKIKKIVRIYEVGNNGNWNYEHIRFDKNKLLPTAYNR